MTQIHVYLCLIQTTETISLVAFLLYVSMSVMDKSRQQQLTAWLRQHRRLASPWSHLCILIGLLSTALLIFQAWLLATLLHGLIIAHLPRTDFIATFFLLVGIAVSRAILVWFKERCGFLGAAKLRHHFRVQVLTEFKQRGPLYLKQQSAGHWVSILMDQIEHLHDFYAKFLPQSMLSGLQPLLILCFVFPVNWVSGVILLGTAPLIPIFMILTGMGAADASRRNFQTLARLSSYFLDRLKGMRTLHLFHRIDAETETMATAANDFRERTMEVLRIAFLSSAVLEFFASVSIALVAVYFGFTYLGHLDLTSGHVSLFVGLFVLLLAPDFYLPLRELGSFYHAKMQAVGAADTLESFLSQEITPVVSGTENFHATQPCELEATDLEVLSSDGKTLLGPINFRIQSGDIVAVVGKTGAGKSSLIHALLGFTAYRGSLKVNGQELSTIQLSDYRRYVGWLSQNPRLLPGTIRDNLALGQPELDDEALSHAIDTAGARDIIAEKGLDYLLTEQNGGVSVGQAQRLALARTLLKPRQLLLLDEPTASLDRLSERQILTALDTIIHQQTTLLITHRPDQLQQAKQIFLIEQGQLTDQGTFAELSARNSVFNALMAQPDATEK